MTIKREGGVGLHCAVFECVLSHTAIETVGCIGFAFLDWEKFQLEPLATLLTLAS